MYIETNFKSDVELLKYNKIKNKDYYVLNVINLIDDCIDLNKSIIIRDANNEILRIEKHIFKEHMFNSNQIFKVREYPDKIFVTDGFKELIEDNKLTGAEFIRSDMTLRDLFHGAL